MSTIALDRSTYAAAGNRTEMSFTEKAASTAKNITPYIISGLLSMNGRTNAYQICSMMQER